VPFTGAGIDPWCRPMVGAVVPGPAVWSVPPQSFPCFFPRTQGPRGQSSTVMLRSASNRHTSPAEPHTPASPPSRPVCPATVVVDCPVRHRLQIRGIDRHTCVRSFPPPPSVHFPSSSLLPPLATREEAELPSPLPPTPCPLLLVYTQPLCPLPTRAPARNSTNQPTNQPTNHDVGRRCCVHLHPLSSLILNPLPPPAPPSAFSSATRNLLVRSPTERGRPAHSLHPQRTCVPVVRWRAKAVDGAPSPSPLADPPHSPGSRCAIGAHRGAAVPPLEPGWRARLRAAPHAPAGRNTRRSGPPPGGEGKYKG